MIADGKFKYYKVWNKDEWCVSETYFDEDNTCHHHILFQYATRDEAKEIADRLNRQQAKEDEYLERNKRFTFVEDEWGEYKILDNGSVLVDEIPQKSSAKVLVDTLNGLESDKVLMEQWANGLKQKLNSVESRDNDELYKVLRDKVYSQSERVRELEKENKRLWRLSQNRKTS